MYMKSFVLALSLSSGAVAAGEMKQMTGPQHAVTTEHAAAASAPAAPRTDGEIRKVDSAAQKLTVKHGPIENLGMSPMTMVFRVADPALLKTVQPGDKVKMTVERIEGALTIVALQRIP